MDAIKPRLTKLVAAIKDQAPHARMMMHSCGSIFTIIPDLIDAGVDVFRINFSHGNWETHERSIQMIRGAEQRAGRPIAIVRFGRSNTTGE